MKINTKPEYPQVSSFIKPSFSSNDTCVKSPSSMNFDNCNLNFVSVNPKHKNKAKIFPKTLDPFEQEKRFSFQINVIKKPVNLEMNKKRNSWHLMKNFVKGLNGFFSPEVRTINSIVSKISFNNIYISL